jgi:hypothetical protein
MVGLAVFAPWLFALFERMRAATIRVVEITDTEILLDGVAEAFILAIDAAETEHITRVSQWAQLYEADPNATTMYPPSTDLRTEGRASPHARPTDAFKE